MLGESIATIWANTKSFFEERNPPEVARAEADPKHKMALCFRWYLGLSSRWAITGNPDRKMDYQIWCGPAMGAFNEWVKNTFLEKPEYRNVVTVGFNILYGAAVLSRINHLRMQGIRIPSELSRCVPKNLEDERQHVIGTLQGIAFSPERRQRLLNGVFCRRLR